MGGRIAVSFRRDPSFLSVAAMQGSEVQVVVAREEGRVIGVGTRALRPTFVNGILEAGGYLSDLRVHPSRRGGTIIARGYRRFRELHGAGAARVYSTVIVADNATALSTIAAGRAGLPTYTDLGLFHTPMLAVPRSPSLQLPDGIRRGGEGDWLTIVARLNADRAQLAPAWRVCDFTSGRFPGLTASDFVMTFGDGGRCTGVMALWDQRSFKQTVVTRYGGALRWARPLLNTFLRPNLPRPGSVVPFGYAAFAAADDSDCYRRLLRAVLRDARRRGLDRLCAGLHERDSRLGVLGEHRRTNFAGRLFAVTYGGTIDLDDRVPVVEAALL